MATTVCPVNSKANEQVLAVLQQVVVEIAALPGNARSRTGHHSRHFGNDDARIYEPLLDDVAGKRMCINRNGRIPVRKGWSFAA